MIYIKSGKRQILDFKVESLCVPTVDYDLPSEQQSGIHTTKNDLHSPKFALRDAQHFSSEFQFSFTKKDYYVSFGFHFKSLCLHFERQVDCNVTLDWTDCTFSDNITF